MTTLTHRQKLALMMTSARSQRHLASLIFATHQQVGRWLKGISPVKPDYFNNIDFIFEEHKRISKNQAREDNLPFNFEIPIYLERGYLRTGKKGDRAIVTNTKYIDEELRNKYFLFLRRSNKFVMGMIRSTMSMIDYFENAAKNVILEKGLKSNYKKLGEKIRKQFYEKTYQRVYDSEKDIQANDKFVEEIFLTEKIRPFYTRYQPMSRSILSDADFIREINNNLRQKHQPATGTRGTALADEFVLQTYPANYVPLTKKIRKPKVTNKRGK